MSDRAGTELLELEDELGVVQEIDVQPSVRKKAVGLRREYRQVGAPGKAINRQMGHYPLYLRSSEAWGLAVGAGSSAAMDEAASTGWDRRRARQEGCQDQQCGNADDDWLPVGQAIRRTSGNCLSTSGSMNEPCRSRAPASEAGES